MQKIKSEADLYYYNKYLKMEPGINLGFGENYLLWRDLENHPGVRTLLDWGGGEAEA